MKIIALLLALTFISACTTRAVYEGSQVSSRNECSKLPPSQYEECISNTNIPYHDYERERKEVVGH